MQPGRADDHHGPRHVGTDDGADVGGGTGDSRAVARVAEDGAARRAAEEDAARRAAEDEAARRTAEDGAARRVAEEDAARRAALWAEVGADFRATAHRTGLAAPPARVRRALEAVSRERFVPAAWRAAAWENRPLPIGHRQTISQPFIVALMTALLDPLPTDRVLEIGTGCGYQTAVLAKLAGEVASVERVAALGERAREALRALGVANVQVHLADGWQGWPARAPYQRILVTAAPEEVPPALLAQLARPGRLVLPVGDRYGGQVLRVIDVDAGGASTARDVLDVRFVPMPGGIDDHDDHNDHGDHGDHGDGRRRAGGGKDRSDGDDGEERGDGDEERGAGDGGEDRGGGNDEACGR